jgi:glycosyltransferase involved in cell wall biosynthesis
MSIKNKVTIVIPSKNEGVAIIEVIDLILSQVDCEIIISDSSDDLISKSVIKDYASKKSNIKIICGGMPAIARNNGAKLVKTPHILFLDADTYLVNKNTINTCLIAAIDNDYDLVTCKFITDNKFNWIYKAFNLIQWISSKTKPFCPGGFMLFKTETFNNLQGFNEKDKIAEDYHISSKIKPKKFKVVDVYVYTPSRRFQKKGVWFMIKLAFVSWINRNNDSWFTKDYNYFS